MSKKETRPPKYGAWSIYVEKKLDLHKVKCLPKDDFSPQGWIQTSSAVTLKFGPQIIIVSSIHYISTATKLNVPATERRFIKKSVDVVP